MSDSTPRPRILLTDDGLLETFWAFLRQRFEERLAPTCEIEYLDVRTASMADVDWPTIDAVALFGGELTEEMISRATRLAVVGSETDNLGIDAIETLWKQGIPFVEGTPGWGPSVAECGLALILAALRRVPFWHQQVIDGFRPWDFEYVQFCDDDRFVNGTIGGKTIGVLGAGEIGGRLAQWCSAMGARVIAHDPYRGRERFAAINAEQVGLDELMQCDVLVIATPDTPSVTGVVGRDQVYALRRGALVVTLTRAAAIDTAALRERVLADELAWAADVYDVEPLPPGDPIIGRANVVHLPHIAGRTKDANHGVADLIADDFLRVFTGHAPIHVTTPERLRVRTGADPGTTLITEWSTT